MAEKPDFTPFQVLLHLENVVMAYIYLIFDRLIAHQYNKPFHICKTYILYIWTVVFMRLLQGLQRASFTTLETPLAHLMNQQISSILA